METPKTAMLGVETQKECNSNHKLFDKWVLWAHLPHDTDWSLDSYKKIIIHVGKSSKLNKSQKYLDLKNFNNSVTLNIAIALNIPE